MKYSVIIPCYNEGENVFNLVNELKKCTKKYDIEYILVENGSLDNTRKLLETACKGSNRFKIVYVDVNRGYGYGILKGLDESSGDYVGWLHADLQVAPKEIISFIRFLEKQTSETRYLLKGARKQRSLYDNFFSAGMTLFELILFHEFMYEIPAIPVLFSRELLKEFNNPPYDFSIDLYIYYLAKKNKYTIRHKPVIWEEREEGASSWNQGILSKIKQSIIIINDSIKIRKGEQVF